jgi:glycosyltransferase involved in cell wall biosynthesis
MENKEFDCIKKNLVSVVLTNFNKEKFVLEQLESIVSQTYKNWELIIMDDCSTDGSREIIRKFIEKNKNEKIIFIENDENLGVAKNFESGLRFAAGEYIAACDSDDVWLSDKLEKELQFLRKGSYGLVYSDMIVVDENLRIINRSFMQKGLSFFCRRKDETFFELIGNNHIPGPTILFQAKLKNKLVPFSKYAIQDHWIAIICAIFSTIGYLNVPTVLYRQSSGNMVGAKALSPARLILKRDKICLDKHLRIKKNSLLFLSDLLKVEGMNSKMINAVNKRIEKTKKLVNCLSGMREEKVNTGNHLVDLWKIGAFSEILQVIYFMLFYKNERNNV